jgi:peptide/nickel transport system permease protein
MQQPNTTVTVTPGAIPRKSLLARWHESDLWWSLKHSPLALGAGVILVLIVLGAVFAPWLVVQDPFDMAQLDLLNAELPPAWEADGDPQFLLGTDNQGRDILAAILYGSRISLMIGAATVVLSFAIGIFVGLVSGYFGGWLDNLLMRIGDTILSIPTILVAILVTAVFRQIFPSNLREAFAALILVLAISMTSWVQYARTVRAAAMVERRKEYVQAAMLIGVKPLKIMLGHILPNTLTPVMVTATLNLGLAILIEATLSFLGIGMPATQPSLGTLIRIGNQYLFSGQWWVILFPSVYLCLLVLAVNLLGDWLRDALNPRLK